MMISRLWSFHRSSAALIAVFTLISDLSFSQDSPPPLVGDTEQLAPKFFPGKVYTYVNETKVTMTLPGPEGSTSERTVQMGHQAKLVTSARVDGAEGISIDASTDRFQFTVTTPDREMKYDSDDESTKDSALGKHFEGSRRRTLTLQLDESLKVVSSEEKGGGGPATPMPGMPQFGADELKQLILSLLQGFPPDPVKPGSEWTQKGKRSLGQFGEMDFEINYRYKGDETIDGAHCSIIEFSGGMKGDVEVSGSSSGRLGFEGTELKGRLVFDKLRRTARESSQTVKMTIDVPNPDPLIKEKLRLPMTQEISVKLVALGDA